MLTLKSSRKYSKGMLQEGEQELERAKRVGKEGLLGYMEDNDGGDVDRAT